jgi:hypothetical protein
MADFGLIRCSACQLVLPADAYPHGEVAGRTFLLASYAGWCTQCIRDDQAQEHGLAAAVLRDRATLRRTIALAIDDRVVTA